jgi:hypothetical protein
MPARAPIAVALTVLLQMLIGMNLVWQGWPLWLATAHNGGLHSWCSQWSRCCATCPRSRAAREAISVGRLSCAITRTRSSPVTSSSRSRHTRLRHGPCSSCGRSLDLTVLKSPPHSPQANAICERVIGTIRRECLDWLIPLSESHLRSIIRAWAGHYNHGRPRWRDRVIAEHSIMQPPACPAHAARSAKSASITANGT